MDDLITKLRERARRKMLQDPDRAILQAAADALDQGGLTPEAVETYFAEREIKLMPWQRVKLGLEDG